MTAQAFPKISARNLEGLTFEIPKGLTGEVNLVVLAFAREHQKSIETWHKTLASMEKEHPGFQTWYVAALARRNRVWRGAVDSGMRAGIQDGRLRQHTLTSYMDLNGLQRDLGLPDLADICLYLLAEDGTIRWQAQGSYSEDAVVSLREGIADLER
jgi:hypothetical protein